MNKCKYCKGTGQIPKKKTYTSSFFSSFQIDGLVKKTETCPKCFGKGMK